MEYLFKMERKAQSQIISTVILILIVISLAIIILNFAVPFVKDRLAGTSCLDVVGQVTFSNSPTYTCFNKNSDPDEIRLQVHIGDIDDILKGFLIELGGASTRSIQIINGSIVNNVKMFGLSYTDPLELPGRNEERTYVIKGEFPETINIYPLLKDGNVCGVSDSIDRLDSCR